MAVPNFFALTAKDKKHQEISMKEFEGKVVLVVNVASKCGFTKQYTGLEELYKKYKDEGFVILGFPCNQFGGQVTSVSLSPVFCFVTALFEGLSGWAFALVFFSWRCESFVVGRQLRNSLSADIACYSLCVTAATTTTATTMGRFYQPHHFYFLFYFSTWTLSEVLHEFPSAHSRRCTDTFFSFSFLLHPSFNLRSL